MTGKLGSICRIFPAFAAIIILNASVHARTVERIVAVVNDRVITMSDMEEEIAIKRQLGEKAETADVLETLIERELASGEINRLGLSVAIDEVTNAVLQFEGRFPSKGEFNDFLEIYQLSLQDLSRRFASMIAVDKVRQQKNAISPERYEKWLEDAKKKADIRIIFSEISNEQ